ncbi:MAG: hypothetical protein RML35_07920 [Chloroherpetonaceae bacterium]|nr:hypothetical protein [Chloroherpetonaceae bacterium]
MIKQTLHRLKRNEVQLALFAFLSCVSGAAIVVLTLTSLDLSKEADIAFAVLGGFVIGSIIATVVYRIVKRNRELAESLQKVTESLNEANSQLQFYNESLTDTVKKRTEELLFAELQYRSLFELYSRANFHLRSRLPCDGS